MYPCGLWYTRDLRSHKAENMLGEFHFCPHETGKHVSWNRAIKVDGIVETSALKVFNEQLVHQAFKMFILLDEREN